MKPEDYELLKNPVFVLAVILLTILITIYQKQRIKRSEATNEKNKIVAFFPKGFGVIPLRESFYDVWNRKRIVSIIILSVLMFFGPLALGIYFSITEGFDRELLVGVFTVSTMFLGVLFHGWIRSKRKQG